MKKVIVILMTGLVLSLGATGCIESKDPETGEKTYQVDPNAVIIGEAAGEGGITLLGILSLFYPALIPVTTAAVAGLATWKKMKPKLTEAQSKAKMFHSAGQVTAIGLEKFKKDFPAKWAGIAVYLNETKKELLNPEDRLRIENLIRGFIGKAPKE